MVSHVTVIGSHLARVLPPIRQLVFLNFSFSTENIDVNGVSLWNLWPRQIPQHLTGVPTTDFVERRKYTSSTTSVGRNEGASEITQRLLYVHSTRNGTIPSV